MGRHNGRVLTAVLPAGMLRPGMGKSKGFVCMWEHGCMCVCVYAHVHVLHVISGTQELTSQEYERLWYAFIWFSSLLRF